MVLLGQDHLVVLGFQRKLRSNESAEVVKHGVFLPITNYCTQILQHSAFNLTSLYQE